MIADFFQMQMDYIFFFYGLGFILLSAAAHAVHQVEKELMPWKWLCLFSLAHGINEWLDMLTFSLKDNQTFSVMRLIVLIVSFLFLIEFGRAGSKAIHGKGTERWIIVPLMAFVGLGAFEGMSGLNAAARYALGLTGGLWTALVLWQYQHTAHLGKRPLRLAAISMGIYALATGLVVAPAPFFPASIINHASFFALTSFPIQLLRGVMACLAAAATWQYYGAIRRTTFKDAVFTAPLRYERWTIAVVTLVLSMGWVITCSVGEFGYQMDKEQYNAEIKLLQNKFETSVKTANSLVQTMAESPNLKTIGSKGGMDLAAINFTLDNFAGVIQNSICYLMDLSGTTLASSNRDTPTSFVGHSYAIRPYFKEAIKGSSSTYVAEGLTSKTPGYYTSYPVRDSIGKIVGVAVLKFNLDNLIDLPIQENYAFLVDPNGVILSSTVAEYQLRVLWPLSEEVRRRMIESQQFLPLSAPPLLQVHFLQGAKFTFHDRTMQSIQQSTGIQDISLVVFGSVHSWKFARLMGILITLIVALSWLVPLIILQTNSDASARIAASERVYRTLVEGSPNWVGLFDYHGHCVAINQKGLKAMNRSDEEVKGKVFSEIWPKEIGSSVEYRISCVLSGEQVDFEASHILSDGSVKILNTLLNPIFELDGAVSAFVGIATDITEHKQAEALLRRSEQKYRELVENANSIILHWTHDGRLTFLNEFGQRFFGYSEEEIIGKHVVGTIVPEIESTGRDLLPLMGQICADPKAFENNINENMRRNGERVWIAWTNKVDFDDQDQVKGILSIGTDITERKRAEDALKESEERYRGIFDDSITAIYLFNLDKIFIDSNQAGLDLLGYSKQELLHMSIPDVEADPEAVIPAHQQLLSGGRLVNYEHKLRKKDGTIITVLNNSRPLTAPNGKIVGMLSTLIDITESKTAQNKLKKSESRYRLLAENANDVIWTIGMDMQLTYISPSVTKLLGFTINEAKLQSISQLFTPVSFENSMRVINEELEIENSGQGNSSRSRMIVMELNHKNGSIVPVEGNFSFLRDPSGKAIGILAIIRDITERKITEKKITSALQEKEILLREIHHRVKNNLQVICSLINLQIGRIESELTKTALIETQQRVVSMALIHETLYGGNNFATINLRTYLKKLIKHLQNVYCDRTEITVHMKVSKIMLHLDQAAPCGLIINELITNAFKHAFPNGRKGTIQIEACLVDNKDILINVIDDGIGFGMNIDLENPPTLGLRLVLGLLKHQLKGKFDIFFKGGTNFTMRWPLPIDKGAEP